jgi:polyhydroxybutyrate depolymerase
MIRVGKRAGQFLAIAGAVAIAACGSSSGPAGNPPPTVLDAPTHDAGSPPISTSTSVAGDDDASVDAAPSDAAAPFSCSGKAGAKGDMTISITSNGTARSAILHVPSSYDATAGTMLVLNFHGFGSNASQQVLLTNMSAASDTENFIVVYPDGIGAGWDAGDCCNDLQAGPVDDLQFVKDLLKKLQTDYCIDPKRIYATGMSNGGFMTHYLACEMADVIAAAAPVAGVLGIPQDQCKPARPIPILDFHGTADPVVPYNGGSPSFYPAKQFLSAPVTMNNWRLRDDCFNAPKTTYAQGDATCIRYDGCNANVDVTFCTIDGGGHTWPGGLPVPTLGKTSTDIDATKTMLEFFRAHPLP